MLWENNMHHEHHFDCESEDSGREAVYDSFASLSLPTLHRTPPPLPPSGLNPGHCQKAKNPRLIYWGKGEAEVCCNIFPCFLYLFITF